MAVTAPEFSWPVRAHEVGGRPRAHEIVADTEARAALAARFALLALDTLTATLTLVREASGIRLAGEVFAIGVQACVTTAVAVPFQLKTPVSLLLVQQAPPDEDMELGAADLDVELLDGDIIDLGEWAAQALALALDPFPRSGQTVAGVLSEDEATMARSPFAMLRKP